MLSKRDKISTDLTTPDVNPQKLSTLAGTKVFQPQTITDLKSEESLPLEESKKEFDNSQSEEVIQKSIQTLGSNSVYYNLIVRTTLKETKCKLTLLT